MTRCLASLLGLAWVVLVRGGVLKRAGAESSRVAGPIYYSDLGSKSSVTLHYKYRLLDRKNIDQPPRLPHRRTFGEARDLLIHPGQQELPIPRKSFGPYKVIKLKQHESEHNLPKASPAAFGHSRGFFRGGPFDMTGFGYQDHR